MFVSGLGSWDVGLVTSASDLSFGSGAFGPASFLKRIMFVFGPIIGQLNYLYFSNISAIF